MQTQIETLWNWGLYYLYFGGGHGYFGISTRDPDFSLVSVVAAAFAGEGVPLSPPLCNVMFATLPHS